MDRWQIEVARNVAANARLFCAMLFAVSLAAFIGGHGLSYGRLAVLWALPVGIACILDQMPDGWHRAVAAVCLYGFTAILALTLLIKLG